MYKDIIELINSVGFPIFVGVFLLLRTSKDTQGLTKMIEELTIWLKAQKWGEK